MPVFQSISLSAFCNLYFCLSVCQLETLNCTGGKGEGSELYSYDFRFKNKIFWEGSTFLEALSFRRVDLPSPKRVINLSWTFKKRHCKGEPYRFASFFATHRDRQTSCYLYKRVIGVPVQKSIWKLAKKFIVNIFASVRRYGGGGINKSGSRMDIGYTWHWIY